MAVRVYTSRPKQLLAAIKKAIDDGKVTTWKYNSSNEFDHCTSQWTGAARLVPRIDEGKSLTFLVCYPHGKDRFAQSVFGVYHGRFVEMLANHFNDQYSHISVGKVESLVVSG